MFCSEVKRVKNCALARDEIVKDNNGPILQWC